ncbi:MAG: STAS domain-containing protein [Rhodocyclaceae bacterium]|jgi:phospholipid transport system transporter-binding protein|nr:STAS domain-containing protein [Rhodocyclaceae bacterium]
MSAGIQQTAGGLAVTGNMTMETAATLLSTGIAAFDSGEPACDLSAVTHIDSAGLAVLFGWQRAVEARGQTLRIASPPSGLIGLAEVYGVTELLSLS